MTRVRTRGAGAAICAAAVLVTTPGWAINPGREAPCEVPPGFRLVASSPSALVFVRGRFGVLRGCLRGENTLYRLGEADDESLVRTRGRWVVHPEAFTTDEDGDFYDLVLTDLRQGKDRFVALPGDSDKNRVRKIALGGRGVLLYVQPFGDRERLVLAGQTRRRRLGSQPVGTFKRLRVKGLRASWTEGSKRHSVRFRVVDK